MITNFRMLHVSGLFLLTMLASNSFASGYQCQVEDKVTPNSKANKFSIRKVDISDLDSGSGPISVTLTNKSSEKFSWKVARNSITSNPASANSGIWMFPPFNVHFDTDQSMNYAHQIFLNRKNPKASFLNLNREENTAYTESSEDPHYPSIPLNMNCTEIK